MQMLHPRTGSVQDYRAHLDGDLELTRPRQCPQCPSKKPLTGHGFYQRTIEDANFDGVIRIRRYRCKACKCTTSMLPGFALPWLRSSIARIAVFLVARLLLGHPLAQSLPGAPYQRGQFWIRRFRSQAEKLALALAAITQPPPAPDFVRRALLMLETAAWIPAHRFLFAHLRVHLLGWPPSLAPSGLRRAVAPAAAPSPA